MRPRPATFDAASVEPEISAAWESAGAFRAGAGARSGEDGLPPEPFTILLPPLLRIAVLHRGRLIYERYFGALKPHKPHIAMSVTKSFTGTLAGILIAEGKIDPQAPVTDYVPELKASAFGDARVHDVMDMTTGLKYTEVYTDKNSDVWGLRRANGMAPIPPGYEGATTIFDFLRAQQKQGEHGKAFAYKTVNTDVLAWIIRRASGMKLSNRPAT